MPAKASGRQLRVYRAEDLFMAALDTAGDSPAKVTFEGVSLHLLGDRKLGSPEAVQQYSDRVLRATAHRYTNASTPLTWRFDGRYHNLHYRKSVAIAPPFPHPSYREVRVLHEIAHHLVDDLGATGHGEVWVEAYVGLVDEFHSTEAAMYLRYLLAATD